MKRSSLVLLSTVLLFGCRTTDNTPAQETSSGAAIKEEVPVSSEPSAVSLDQLLEGDWYIVPKGTETINEVSAVVLSFSGNTMLTENKIQQVSSRSSLEYGDIYNTGTGQITKMTVTPEEITGTDAEESNIVSVPVDFQILYTVFNHEEILAIRELGNGMSYFGMSMLDLNYQDPQYFWIFRRESETAEEPETRNTDSTFYAFCWKREIDALWLQEIRTEEFEDNMYDEDVTMLKLIPDYTLHKFAIRYPAAEDIQWRIRPSTAFDEGSLSPLLARVTTDSSGMITKLDYMDYLGYGFYEATESSMFKYKDLLPTDTTDIIFAYYPGDILTSEDDMVFADVSKGDPVQNVIFFTKKNVKKFRLLSLTFKDSNAEGMPVFEIQKQFLLEKFSPAHPLCAAMTFFGSIPNNGISYKDTDGTIKYYSVSVSGIDGSLELDEFIPE